MLISAALTAGYQIFSPPFRRILWRCLGATLVFLAIIWFIATRFVTRWLDGQAVFDNSPVLEGFSFFFAGAGLMIVLAYFIPVISTLVAGVFADDAAEIVERTHYPNDPVGKPLSLARSLRLGARFAGISLLVNAVALMLVFIPGVNLIAFFWANAYLFGREYFELAAGRFRPMPEATRLRRAHRGTVLLAGMMTAGLVLVPVVNLLTPLFGVALMVHVHKKIEQRDRLVSHHRL